MGFRLPGVVSAKQRFRRSASSIANRAASSVVDVPKEYMAVFVCDDNTTRRFIIPVSYLNQPFFQELLSQAEEEFGFDHPMGGLTIPRKEDVFVDLISHFNS